LLKSHTVKTGRNAISTCTQQHKVAWQMHINNKQCRLKLEHIKLKFNILLKSVDYSNGNHLCWKVQFSGWQMASKNVTQFTQL